MASGSGAEQASLQAHKVIDGMVTRQAALLTYMDVFLGIGIFFLICVPLVLLIKPAKSKVDMSNVGH